MYLIDKDEAVWEIIDDDTVILRFDPEYNDDISSALPMSRVFAEKMWGPLEEYVIDTTPEV